MTRGRRKRGRLAQEADSPALFRVNELAEVMGVNAFYIHKYFRDRGYPTRNIPGTAIKVMYASVFCHFYRDLKDAIVNVRDDRCTRNDPNRIPTIQNMLYRDPTKPPLSKHEREDIDRDIFASSKLELTHGLYYFAGMYRVNYYKDGTMSIDHFKRISKVWDRVTPIFRKELFVDYILEFDLMMHDPEED